MKRRNRRFPTLLVLLVGATVTSLGARPAQAQWDMGWGLFGGFNTVPSPGNFLNDRALIQASRGIQPRPSHSPLSGNPNAYFNRVRDNGFVPHYNVQSRLPPAYQPASRRSLGLTSNAPTPPQPATAQPAPRPLLPVASFFDAAQRLVWPGEAPVDGDLREKRDTSDQASLVVLNETKEQGVASITSVVEARQRLLDYGQPALQAVRRDQTPRIADSFHHFLLSLYESLAQAATASPQP
jgi:hypothetical protein